MRDEQHVVGRGTSWFAALAERVTSSGGPPPTNSKSSFVSGGGWLLTGTYTSYLFSARNIESWIYNRLETGSEMQFEINGDK